LLSALKSLLGQEAANYLPTVIDNTAVVALLEHVVQMVTIINRRQQDLAPIFNLINAVLNVPENTRLLVLKKSLCFEVLEHNHETPLYLATSAAIAEARYAAMDEWLEALQLIDHLGFNATMDKCVGVVIDLGGKTLLDPTHSYTLSGLPGTLYCEHVPSRVRLAEMLLHEATHTWLNYAFKARQPSGFSLNAYWSPWRHKPHPAYGILQGAFVFSLLCQFFDACIADSDVDSVDKAYAASRLGVEVQVLRNNLAMLEQALDEIQDGSLRATLAEDLNRALNLCASTAQKCNENS